MSEWNVIHEIFHTKHSVLTAPDEHMPYINQYMLWAYDEHVMSKWSSRTSDRFIWLVSEKKTEAVSAYLIKNTKGEGRVGGGGGSEGSSKDWAELYGYIK